MARRAVKKDRIIEAAIRLFATRGLARTTIREIAAAAGVAEGALYRHWPGKMEMGWDLYCRTMQRFIEPFEAVLRTADGPLKARVGKVLRFLYGYYRDHPLEFGFILLIRHHFPGQDAVDPRHGPHELVVRFVRRQMDEGAIGPGDAELLATLLMGAVLQPVVMHQYGQQAAAPIEQVEPIAVACVAVLRSGAGGREGRR